MKELLLEIGKADNADAEKIVYKIRHTEQHPYFIGLLAANRMCGLAYYVLRKNEFLQLLNREFRGVLDAVYQYNCLKNQSFIECRSELAKLLQSAGISYAALKGAYLVQLYPEGTRTSNDLDILVSRDSVTELSALLKKHGFIQGFIRNDRITAADRSEVINAMLHRGETIPFVKEVNLPCMKFMEVDVNTSLNENPEQTHNIIKIMLADKVKINSQKQDMPNAFGWYYTLEEHDFLIQLCVHLYKEAVNDLWIQRGQAWTLYKFTDIYLFCFKRLNFEWAEIFINKVRQYKLEKECFFSLNYMNQLLKFPDNKGLQKILTDLRVGDNI